MTMQSSLLKAAAKRLIKRAQMSQQADNAGAFAIDPEKLLRGLRPEQIMPNADHPLDHMRTDDWGIWVIQAGRGWGKTLSGAAATKKMSERCPRIAIVAPTFSDARDTCVEGESGLKALIPNLDFHRSIGEMTFPSGAKGKIFSAEEPDRLNGPNNYFAWCDEFGLWKYQREAWDQLMFTLRKGEAKCVITNTPNQTPLYRELKKRPSTILTRGSSYDNIANLSKAYVDRVIKPYEGTTLGRIQINAEDIDEVEGALWTRALIDAHRVNEIPELVRIIVAIDPAASNNENSDENGIVVGGKGRNGHGYLLADRSLIASPSVWGNAAVGAYGEFDADRMIAEVNNGGDMVEYVIKTIDPSITVKKIHASRGKQKRAEPIASLYEQGKVHHVGAFPLLEDQMCSWIPGNDDFSPDRMDAAVWCLTELMLNGGVTKVSNRNPLYGG